MDDAIRQSLDEVTRALSDAGARNGAERQAWVEWALRELQKASRA